MKKAISLLIIYICLTTGVQAQGVDVQDVVLQRQANALHVEATLDFTNVPQKSTQLHAYRLALVSQVDTTISRIVSTVLVAGRREYYATLRNGSKAYPTYDKILRHRTGDGLIYKECQDLTFEEWMSHAELRLYADLCGCGMHLGEDAPLALQEIHVIPVAERLCALSMTKIRPVVRTEQKEYALSGRAYLDFPVNRTELYPDYRKNPTELQKILQTIDAVRADQNATITAFRIHGYASPEGSFANNVRLSQGRAQTLLDYVQGLYRFPSEVARTVRNTPEDWTGLDSVLNQAKGMDGVPHADAILALLRQEIGGGEAVTDDLLDQLLAREGAQALGKRLDALNDRIKADYPQDYAFILSTWYPALRHSDYEVAYRVRAFTTPEEAEAVYRSGHPEHLSLNELYMVAEYYGETSAQYEDVIMYAVGRYPTDADANYNAAAIRYNAALAAHRADDADRKRTELNLAAAYIRLAAQEMGVNGEDAAAQGGDAQPQGEAVKFAASKSDVQALQGSILLLQENLDAAEPLLRAAAADGNAAAEHNLRVLEEIRAQ